MTTLSQSLFISVVVQAILHGIYIVTLLHCLQWLVYDEARGLRKEIKWPILIVSMVIFLLSTIDLGIRFWAVLGPAMTGNGTLLSDINGVASVCLVGSTWSNNEWYIFHRV